MPVVGLTSIADKWNGNVTFSFNATGFSVKSEINDNGYERGVSYLSVNLYKDIPGAGTKSYYDIVQSDPENPGIPGFTAHYLRMSASKQFTPASHSLQYVRFYLGNPQYQGEYVCIAEFDFT